MHGRALPRMGVRVVATFAIAQYFWHKSGNDFNGMGNA